MWIVVTAAAVVVAIVAIAIAFVALAVRIQAGETVVEIDHIVVSGCSD